MKTISPLKLRLALAIGLVCASAFGARAQMRGYQRNGPAPTWDFTLGAGAVYRPTFEGSDRYRFRPIPFASVTWRDTISFGEGGLSAYWHNRNFRIGGGLTFDGGRKDHSTGSIFGGGDDRLMGLGTIDASLGLRGFASYRLGPVNFDVSATKFTGSQNKGVLANFGAGIALPLGRRLILMPHVRATWANGNYTQTYFGVTAAQSLASVSHFPIFNAGSGFKDVSAGVNIIYRLGNHWSLVETVGVTQLLGDAKRSPISISDTSATALTAIAYHF